jgi:hypothetical protein
MESSGGITIFLVASRGIPWGKPSLAPRQRITVAAGCEGGIGTVWRFLKKMRLPIHAIADATAAGYSLAVF